MTPRSPAVGERSTAILTGQKQVGRRWQATTGKQKPERFRARARYRDHAGVGQEICRYAKTRHEAEAALNKAIDEALAGTVDMTSTMSFIEAGRLWKAHMKRQSETDAGISASTAEQYEATFDRYVDAATSQVRGLTLTEANNPQRLLRFLHDVADNHGTATAKLARTVVSGVLRLAVSNSVLPHNAMRDVDPVKSTTPRKVRQHKQPRDAARAFTRNERDKIIAHADNKAAQAGVDPRTARKRQTVADLIAFMAGTGVRISEARCLLWEDVDLAKSRVEIRGTKTAAAHRALTLPTWLTPRLQARRKLGNGNGYVFAAPSFVADTRRLHDSLAGRAEWDQSNCQKAVRAVLDGAGFEWATGHSFRRTAATLAHAGGAPLVDIADQLGHADPSMTARVYLGRDPFGERASVAAHL